MFEFFHFMSSIIKLISWVKSSLLFLSRVPDYVGLLRFEKSGLKKNAYTGEISLQ